MSGADLSTCDDVMMAKHKTRMINSGQWPDPERPGWPPNPEKDGLYVMRIDEKFIVRYWSATRQHYSLVPGWKQGISPFDASVFTFCGEILTPMQIAEMLAAERERCAKVIVNHSISPSPIDDLSQDAEWLNGCLSACYDEIRNLGTAP